MKGILRYSLLLLATAWLVSACNEHTVYYSFQSIPSEGWRKSDTLFFKVPLTDSLQPLRFYAEVRNLNSYAYRELHLFVNQNFEDSTRWKTDTLTLVLADKDGRWNGDGVGYLYQSAQPLGTIRPKHPGTYTIKVSHGMKNEILTGINDMGFRIEK